MATSTTAPAGSGTPEKSAARRKTDVSGLFEKWALVGALVVLVAVCMATIPQFRTASLFTTMLNAQSLVLLLALTATVVLRMGDFDLSISQTMVASAAVIGQLTTNGTSPAVAIPLALALGACVGLVNALLVVRIGVDSFVATLGSYTALAGLSYLITDSRIVAGASDGFINFSRSQIAGIPLITWYAWILVIVLWYVYQRTPLGRYSLFIGGNRNAATLAGIPVNRIRTGAYVVSGLLAAFLGVCFFGYFGAVDPSAGGQYMLQPFAAAFLGSTAITVGRFNAWGTIAALYLLTVGITALQILGAETWVTNLFYGLALMLSVAAAKIAGRRRAGGAK
ncbi:ABC transporter permease [Nocardioides bruguierae]|uniref:Autoinducer 2 import system permease protein LsrC n=1 Tax=Nocardioides bruguierae TaxID=2945102 RepID=A0A9X2IGV8_9ACTN|nr:ABC transporter permease [Nocardioides bruguierae]MCL8027670.1 ABC transporter permease [Nocardioides bruguierae]MCM0621969.1 ABC transporter permease [Nocardioides bruguierae]